MRSFWACVKDPPLGMFPDCVLDLILDALAMTPSELATRVTRAEFPLEWQVDPEHSVLIMGIISEARLTPESIVSEIVVEQPASSDTSML